MQLIYNSVHCLFLSFFITVLNIWYLLLIKQYFAANFTFCTTIIDLRYNPGESHMIQHSVVKFVKVGGFFPNYPVSSTNTTERHDIAEILL
jgi:hypothetical protein